MRMRGWMGLAGAAALLPGMAAAAPPAGGPRQVGNVPAMSLNAAPGHTAGWGASGWQGAPGRPGMAPPPGRPGMAPPPAGGAGMMPPRPGMGPYPSLPPRPGMAPRPGGAWTGGPWTPGGYAGGRWRGDWNGYRTPYRGYVLPRTWYSPGWYISDWAGWGLSAPYAGYGWYRYYDDAVLVDGRGSVRDYRTGIDWDRSSGGGGATARAYDRGYDDGYHDGYDGGYEDGVDYAEDAVTYRGKWARGAAGREGAAHGGSYGGPPPPYRGGGTTWHPGYGSGGAQVYGAPGGATVIVVQSAPAVVTTTTTYETVGYRRVWHAPARRVWRAAPRCACPPSKLLRR